MTRDKNNGKIMNIGKYQHYKGKEYEVLFIAKDSETLQDVVVYKALYDNDLSQYWVRTKEEFLQTINNDGKEMKRFTYKGDL